MPLPVQQYADLVRHLDLPLLVVRALGSPGDLRVLTANPAARDLVDEVLADAELRHRLARVADDGEPLVIDELVIRSEAAGRRVLALRAFPLADRAVGITLREVTEAVETAEALRRQALHDPLTGLPNRRHLDAELQRLVGDAPVRSSADTVGLLILDLDQFKEVNDALGHHVGDRLLQAIAGRLTRVVHETHGPEGLVARLGGDEFAVVIHGPITEHLAGELAARIRAELGEAVQLDELRIQSNASIGIALLPDHAPDAPTLVRRADVAMYRAKRGGLGWSVYRAEHDRSGLERLTLLGDLPDAVRRGQLRLDYQPCIDLRTGATRRVEALLRWEHPTLGLIGPERFLELAELSGAIRAITRWVFAEAIAAVAAIGGGLGLAVNLSARNLYDPDLVAHLDELLGTHALAPERLVVELGETDLMEDPETTRTAFAALTELGVATSVDRFGAGHSSLSYLRDLPLQEIKIHRSFVDGMHLDPDGFTIVRSLIDLGHNLGLDVVAEGVESADDLDLLRRLRCDLAQGFHLCPPLPAADLGAWLGSPIRGAPRYDSDP